MELSVDDQLMLNLYQILHPIYEYLQITKNKEKSINEIFFFLRRKLTVISTEPLFLIGTSMELV
jgi:hypothetical protein